MAKKYSDTEFAKFRRFMAKVDADIKKQHEKNKPAKEKAK